MTILDKITEAKKAEINTLKKRAVVDAFKATPFFTRNCHSLKEALLDKANSGIIAEFKQKSPSKGVINETSRVGEVTKGYVNAGATGLSVLTDFDFFGGSLENLIVARETNPEVPILRKDFIIDPVQVYETKACGADVMLLIAACLNKKELHRLAAYAKEIGLEVLVEIHDTEDLKKVSPLSDLVGVNNRNLKTFDVDINVSAQLGKLIPEQFVKISESGISKASNIFFLKEAGFKGFLIGETFMKSPDPVKACKEFIATLTK